MGSCLFTERTITLEIALFILALMSGPTGERRMIQFFFTRVEILYHFLVTESLQRVLVGFEYVSSNGHPKLSR
ncbi:hypothetical protein ANTRET_LOCUS3692 [Anthophora retusa]